MSRFLNNSVWVYPIKLKIDMVYHMSNTFRNAVFQISVDIPLMHKNISKKALNFGRFFQCAVYMFLGLNGGFWKINLRILWSHIMKNFQVKYGQCENTIFPKTVSALLKAGFFALESIHLFIIELHVLQCLFVRESNKKQMRGKIISTLTKGETFHHLWQPCAVTSNLTMWSPSWTL